jgi:lipopolysaccharide export system permease protein
MTLGLYVARRLALSFGLIAAVFFGVLLLFEVVEAMRRFGGRDIPLGEILGLAALRVPRTLYQILPLIAILSSMMMFMALARSSELVVIRAAGRSALRVMVEPFLAAILFGALAVAALNPVVAGANRVYQDRLAALNDPDQATRISLDGAAVWLRQGDGAGQTVIRARGVEADGLGFVGVSFLVFARSDGTPLRRIEAARARLEPGAWDLTGARVWDLQAPNPQAEVQTLAQARLATDLTAARIREGFDRASTISVWNLPEFIRLLDRAGLNARGQRAALQAELSMPLMLAAMVLVGAMFTLRHVRAGGAGISLLATVLAGFALFFFRNFAQVLGENGQIPLSLAIWAPPVAAILLAVGVLLHLEDG